MAESLDNNDPTITGAKQGPQLNEQPQRSHQDCACWTQLHALLSSVSRLVPHLFFLLVWIWFFFTHQHCHAHTHTSCCPFSAHAAWYTWTALPKDVHFRIQCWFFKLRRWRAFTSGTIPACLSFVRRHVRYSGFRKATVYFLFLLFVTFCSDFSHFFLISAQKLLRLYWRPPVVIWTAHTLQSKTMTSEELPAELRNRVPLKCRSGPRQWFLRCFWSNSCMHMQTWATGLFSPIFCELVVTIVVSENLNTCWSQCLNKTHTHNCSRG